MDPKQITLYETIDIELSNDELTKELIIDHSCRKLDLTIGQYLVNDQDTYIVSYDKSSIQIISSQSKIVKNATTRYITINILYLCNVITLIPGTFLCQYNDIYDDKGNLEAKFKLGDRCIKMLFVKSKMDFKRGDNIKLYTNWEKKSPRTNLFTDYFTGDFVE